VAADDFIRVAPEFCDERRSHWPWTALPLACLRDRQVSLFSRVVRPLH